MAKTSPNEFIRQVRAEGGKVVWPTREETVRTAVFVGIMMVLLSVFLNATFPVMTASLFWYACVEIVLKAFLIVSVRTKVPLTIATPRMIAKAVSEARSLRPARPRRATVITGSALPSP